MKQFLPLLLVALLSSAADESAVSTEGRPLVAMDTCTKRAYPNAAISTEAQLDLIRQYGYAGVAWTAEDPDLVKALDQAAAARQTPVAAIYVGAELGRDGLKADPRLPAIMTAMKRQGTLIWLHIGSKDFKASDPAGDAVAVPALRQIAAQAEALGLRVAIYPHKGLWSERVSDAVRLARQVDRRNFGVTFNLCHSLMLGEEERIPSLLTEAAPHLFMVTLNGADKGAGGTSWGRCIQPLDRGSYEVKTLLRELDRIGYRGPLAQQGFGCDLAAEDQLSRSMQAWRTVVDGGWRPLAGDAALSSWQVKHGDWTAVAEVSLKPGEEHFLTTRPGQGLLVNGASGKTADLLSAEEWGDCELHLEFMVGRNSNSGVYMMGRYEVQILDSFGVDKPAYPGNECGGIYPRWENNSNVGGHNPRLHAAHPAGQWQTFDIRFRAPRVDAAGKKIGNAVFELVKLNGITVQENVELPGPTRGGYDQEQATGPLRLQGDHGPVAFRNLRWRPLPAR